MATAEADLKELMAAVEVVYKVECTYCGDAGVELLGAGSTHGAAQWFHERGWRTTLDDTLCPDCAEVEL